MEKKGITINDIASALEISPSTVSRALNNSSKISEETKQKVWETASDLGYELNLVASSLSKRKTNVIGVILPVINRFFFSQILSGIEEVAYEHGYRILIAQTNESVVREQEILRMFSSTRVDGVIACLSLETRKVDHFIQLKKNGTPLVQFDRVHYDVDCTKVIVDNYDGANRATEHLIKSGCRRLVHLGGPMGIKVFEERANGFREALKANGLPIESHSILSTDLTAKDVRDSLRYWLELPEPPDGVFTASASTGLALLHMAKSFQIRIPEQLAVISFGNEPCNEYIEPSLSAIEMPGFEMGKSAAKFLFTEISNKNIPPSTIIKPLQLLIRNSSFRKIGVQQ